MSKITKKRIFKVNTLNEFVDLIETECLNEYYLSEGKVKIGTYYRK